MTEKYFNKCVCLHANYVYRFICKNLKDADTSKEVVHNIYEILWKKQGEINMEKAKSYLFTVADNKM